MSEVKVNKISPRTNCGTVQLGDSGDTITIPAGATITNNGTQTGFGRTGTVDWQTGSVKTATFTATNGEGYFANTSGGAFNMNLPAGVAGAIVSVADYASTFSSNNLTIVPNGSDKVGGNTGNVILSTEGQSITLVFVDSTEGWVTTADSSENITNNPFMVATGGTITTCGNDKIHTFTGPGTFQVTNAAACAANNLVSYVVVAGGGGAAGGHNLVKAGGGGAGGFREVKSPATPYTASPLDGYPSSPNRITVTATSFPITVGAGGSGVKTGCLSPIGVTNTTDASKGSNSTFSTITSTGGGQSGTYQNSGGQPGGSGGGKGTFNSPGSSSDALGSGNTPPVTPAQGNDGGNASAYCSSGGGGGGGATAAGGSSPGPSAGGAGGAGATTSISGTPTAYAGGGGGGGVSGKGPGGAGGGGNGGRNTPATPTPTEAYGTDATSNTGGGGGGASSAGQTPTNYADGGSGGSGIVIIRYKFQ